MQEALFLLPLLFPSRGGGADPLEGVTAVQGPGGDSDLGGEGQVIRHYCKRG